MGREETATTMDAIRTEVRELRQAMVDYERGLVALTERLEAQTEILGRLVDLMTDDPSEE